MACESPRRSTCSVLRCAGCRRRCIPWAPLTAARLVQVVLVALAGVFWLCYLRLMLPLRDRLDLAIEVISSIADVFCFVGALVLTIVKTDNVKYTCAPASGVTFAPLALLKRVEIIGCHHTLTEAAVVPES